MSRSPADSEPTGSTIRVVCPNCGTKLNAPGNKSGRQTKCPKCGTGFVLPIADNEPKVLRGEKVLSKSAPDRAPVLGSLTSVRRGSTPAEVPVQHSDFPVAADSNSEPYAPEREGMSRATIWTLAGGAVILALIGGTAIGFAVSRRNPPDAEKPQDEVAVANTPASETPTPLSAPGKSAPTKRPAPRVVRPAPAKPTAPPSLGEPVAKLTINELHGAYRGNVIAADQKYAGKTVELTAIGKVKQSKGRYLLDCVQPGFFGTGQVPGAFTSGAECYINPNQVDGFAKLKEGRSCVIRGRVKGREKASPFRDDHDFIVIVEDCELVSQK